MISYIPTAEEITLMPGSSTIKTFHPGCASVDFVLGTKKTKPTEI
jgi:hypothetical protein